MIELGSDKQFDKTSGFSLSGGGAIISDPQSYYNAKQKIVYAQEMSDR